MQEDDAFPEARVCVLVYATVAPVKCVQTASTSELQTPSLLQASTIPESLPIFQSSNLLTPSLPSHHPTQRYDTDSLSQRHYFIRDNIASSGSSIFDSLRLIASISYDDVIQH